MICAKLQERDNYIFFIALSLENDRKAAWKSSSWNAQIKKGIYTYACDGVYVGNSEYSEQSKREKNSAALVQDVQRQIAKSWRAADHRVYDTFRYSQSVQKNYVN